MTGIQAHQDLGCPPGGHGMDPLCAVDGDMGEQGAAFFAEGIKEAPQGRLATPLPAPHQPIGVMIRHPLPGVRDLVQNGWAIRAAGL